MLKSISYHLSEDESKQLEIEASLAADIRSRLRRNEEAFRRYIPNVYSSIMSSPRTMGSSVFCNKNGQMNIVEYSSGQTLYGISPAREVESQYLKFSRLALEINVDRQSEANESCVPKYVNCISVFGIGIGLHIQWILNNYQINHIIIYEPNVDYFICSLSTIEWHKILRSASESGTKIYLRLGEDGTNFFQDISELKSHFSISTIFIYKHYNHPTFDQLFSALSSKLWTEISQLRFKEEKNKVFNYLPEWTEALDDNQWSESYLNKKRFANNLTVLKKYVPSVFEDIREYKPRCWLPVANSKGHVNVKHITTKAFFYGENPVESCKSSLLEFAKKPNKDGLILDYRGKKLDRYEHYQMVAKCNQALKAVEDIRGELPAEVDSLIIFGLGVGYQLEALIESHNVGNLFICEPNSDFFYSSLFALDWETIFTNIDKQKGRLYLNIGDDGSNLTDDFLKQFHTFGPYLLSNTYFYEGYYNAELVHRVSQLRQQLQTLIAMSDYYDYSKYCISHTINSIDRAVPFLVEDANKKLTPSLQEVPIFIIGNGPSVDSLIDVIRENAHKAILISCGTALQTLHRNGITPDFHAEVEINRSTFDWACRIGDLEYLKTISLASCSSVHPDTRELYKDSYLCFKEGESSSVVLKELFGKHGWANLGLAYPTVANFSLDMVARWGAKQIYLLGIDLGFFDPEYHHSRNSGYYNDDGEARFDYSQDNNTSFTLPGNFRPFVYSKFEFKVSKSILEKAIPNEADVYNLSDGARINGATPLRSEHLLVVTSAKQKNAALETIKQRCFTYLDKLEFHEKFDARFSHEVLLHELNEFLQFANQKLDSRKRAMAYIKNSTERLAEFYRNKQSLLFFLLNGTLNFINSALSKTLNIKDDEKMLGVFSEIRSYFVETCESIKRQLEYDFKGTDFVSSFAGERAKVLLPIIFRKRNISINILNDDKQAVFEQAISSLGFSEVNIGCEERYSIVFGNKIKIDEQIVVCRIICSIGELSECFNQDKKNEVLLYLPGSFTNRLDSPICNDISRIRIAIHCILGTSAVRLVLPKLVIDPSIQKVSDYYDLEMTNKMYAYDCGSYVALSDQTLQEEQMVTALGERYRFIPYLKSQDLVREYLSLGEQASRKQNAIANFPLLRSLK